jgi:hypothetical protein
MSQVSYTYSSRCEDKARRARLCLSRRIRRGRALGLLVTIPVIGTDDNPNLDTRTGLGLVAPVSSYDEKFTSSAPSTSGLPCNGNKWRVLRGWCQVRCSDTFRPWHRARGHGPDGTSQAALVRNSQRLHAYVEYTARLAFGEKLGGRPWFLN